MEKIVKGDINKLQVWKSNKIIEANYRLTVQEQRLIYLLTSQINNSDEEFQEYEFYIADIAEKLGLDAKSQYRHMQEVTGSLVGRRVIIHEKDGPLQVSWLSSAKYFDKEGKVRISFSPYLKPYLLQLKTEFTRLNLNNVIHLNSIYSMRLYELLKQYQALGERTMDIEKLKKMLQITQKSYAIYNNFKQRILLVAEKELFENEKSDIYFTYEEIKETRKVMSIRFFIHAKRKEEQVTMFENETEEVGQELAATVDEEENDDLISQLNSLGMGFKKAVELVEQYSTEQIKVNILYFQKQKNKGVGFLVKAIEQNYAAAEGAKTNAKDEEYQRKVEKYKDVYMN